MKKIIFRTSSMLLIALYMVFFFPTHLRVITDYFSLKKKTDVLFKEMTVLADNLITAKDVDTIIRNSGAEISLSTVMDNGDASSIKPYDGGDLEPSSGRVLEYIISSHDNPSYLFGYLSSYELSYSSISINENKEIVLRIFCS